MNPVLYTLEINRLSGQLRQIANTPNIMNMQFTAVDVAGIRESIITIAENCKADNPKLARQLLAAKEILFATDRLGRTFINPIAIGEILFGLDYLVVKDQEKPAEKQKTVDIWSYIHPLIQKSSKKLFEDGHFANAAEDAFIEINDRTKRLFSIVKPNALVPDGEAAMTTVFSSNTPLIEFCDRSTTTGQNKQKGFMQMLAGAMSALRNPKAHSNAETLSEEEAFRRLAMASMLMYTIDDAVKYSKITE